MSQEADFNAQGNIKTKTFQSNQFHGYYNNHVLKSKPLDLKTLLMANNKVLYL